MRYLDIEDAEDARNVERAMRWYVVDLLLLICCFFVLFVLCL